MNLDALAGRWRTAFDLEADALARASRLRGSLGFSEEELAEHRGRLTSEREAVARLMTAIAREDHVPLHRSVSAPRATRQMLGLPPGVLGCIFDLEGVLTGSASIHAAAWAVTFDELLSRRLERTGERFAAFKPFNPSTDYYRHLHGKPRLEGIHAFLASRGIRLPEGGVDDEPGTETVHGLANRKNVTLRRMLDREGVHAYADTRGYLEAAHEAGLLVAAVSASENAPDILERAGIASLIEACVDGNTIRTECLRSKPEPDTLLAACGKLGVSPAHVADFETTNAGLEAARTAGIGVLIGVMRPDLGGILDPARADVAVPNLVELLAPALVAA